MIGPLSELLSQSVIGSLSKLPSESVIGSLSELLSKLDLALPGPTAV